MGLPVGVLGDTGARWINWQHYIFNFRSLIIDILHTISLIIGIVYVGLYFKSIRCYLHKENEKYNEKFM